MKNILLVMSSSGYLVPPTQDPSHEELWAETWKRLDRFLPDLRKELDLDDQKEKLKPAVVEGRHQEKDDATVASTRPVS